MHPAFTKYEKSDSAHEAGYDAYMTAVIFLKTARMMEVKQNIAMHEGKKTSAAEKEYSKVNLNYEKLPCKNLSSMQIFPFFSIDPTIPINDKDFSHTVRV